MTHSANTTLDFGAIARALTNHSSLSGAQLVPAAAESRQQWEGQQFMRRPAALGATVDQEGLVNNYAVEPRVYFAAFPSPEQARQYAVQAAIAVGLVAGLIFTSVAVS